MRRTILLSVMALAGCSQAATPRGGTTVLREEATGISVQGEGEAKGTPDTAIFTVGVQARRPTVEEARQASARAVTAILDALRDHGVDPQRIQTTQLSLQPDFEYSDQGRRLLGYVATNNVQVRMTDLDRVGAAVDAAIRAAGDDAQLQGIQLELDNDTALRAQAREDAMAEARSTAEQLARLAGVQLGDPVAIEELAVEGGGPGPMMRMEAADAATPISPGQIEVRVRLRVRYAIP